MSETRKRLTLITGLYVSQAIPLGFLIVALPAILRSQGLGLEQTGLLGALALPWLIKFLWAPLVDRFGSSSRGHYRSWIIPLQSLSVLAVIAIYVASSAPALLLANPAQYTTWYRVYRPVVITIEGCPHCRRPLVWWFDVCGATPKLDASFSR